MAELNAPIIAKASATAGEVPLATDLEVAEIAVNTADGKLFTKHTDDSIKEISGSGGGGAVNSVNGETGTVSLGVQEMDDFELNMLFPSVDDSIFRYDSVVPEGGCEVMETAICTYQNKAILGPQAIDVSTGQVAIGLGAILSGWTVGFEFSTAGVGGPWTSTGAVSMVVDEFNCGGVSFSYDIAAVIGNAQTVWVRENGAADPQILPLTEGDVLRWGDANQKFSPAQLSAGGAVDSVNGETGVVSLGIQEMDDYETTTYVFNHSIFSPSPGEWTDNNGDSGISINSSREDANGLILPVLTTSSTLRLSTNGGTNWCLGNPASVTASGLRVDDDLEVCMSHPSQLYIQVLGAEGLEDGQVLTWSATDQKFKPAQAIDKATFKAEVAASTDFADFQSRIAAL